MNNTSIGVHLAGIGSTGNLPYNDGGEPVGGQGSVTPVGAGIWDITGGGVVGGQNRAPTHHSGQGSGPNTPDNSMTSGSLNGNHSPGGGPPPPCCNCDAPPPGGAPPASGSGSSGGAQGMGQQLPPRA